MKYKDCITLPIYMRSRNKSYKINSIDFDELRKNLKWWVTEARNMRRILQQVSREVSQCLKARLELIHVQSLGWHVEE